jgi:hypothetical protein
MATTRGAPCLFTHLFIFLSCHHAKSNTDFMFQCACFHSVFCVGSVHLSSLHRIIICSPKLCPSRTLESICLTLICILFIHTCFSLTSIINIVSLPDNIPRSDVTEQSYNRSRSAFRGLDGLILRPTCLSKPTISCRCTRKKITNANQGQSCTQGQISILASPSIEKLYTINKHTYTYSTTPNQTLL